jgi:propanediol dehydratase small subunit
MRYPLGETARDELVGHVTLDAVISGELNDARVSAETLQRQADFAEQGGNAQLAENLRRGAELVAFGDDELLGFYDMLRPGRSTAAELDGLAAALEERGAARCAALVREARAAYVRRGLIT